MNRVYFLLTSIFLLTISLSGYSQYSVNPVKNETSEVSKVNTPTEKTEVKVNEKMLAKYNKFMDSGEYTSLWETVKDYNLDEMSAFYHTYKNYAFSENTSYEDLKLAAEKAKKQLESEEALPVEPNTDKEEYLTDFQEN